MVIILTLQFITTLKFKMSSLFGKLLAVLQEDDEQDVDSHDSDDELEQLKVALDKISSK